MELKPFLLFSSLVEIIEDGSNDNDEVFDICYTVEKIGSNAGQVLVRKITAGEHMHNGGLVLVVGDVDNPRRGLELEVGNEIVAQYLGLLLELVQVRALGQRKEHTVLRLDFHLLFHAVNLGVFQSHALNNLERGAVGGQVGAGEVPTAGHVVHL